MLGMKVIVTVGGSKMAAADTGSTTGSGSSRPPARGQAGGEEYDRVRGAYRVEGPVG